MAHFEGRARSAAKRIEDGMLSGPDDDDADSLASESSHSSFASDQSGAKDHDTLGKPVGKGTSWNTASRNFAVALVQHLESVMPLLQSEFRGELSLYAFVMLLADFIEALDRCQLVRSTERDKGSKRENMGRAMLTGMRPQLYRLASSAEYLASEEGEALRETIKLWDGKMRYRWDRKEVDDDFGVEDTSQCFHDRNEIEFNLWQLFKAADHTRTGRVRWDVFLAFLIDSTMKGKAGATLEDIKKYTLMPPVEAPSFYRLQKLHYHPFMNSYVAHVKDKDEDVLRIIDDVSLQIIRQFTIPVEYGDLVSFEVVQQYGAIIVSTADTWVRALDVNTFVVRLRRKCGVSATKLKWNVRARTLYCGFRTGCLQAWDITTLERPLHLSRDEVPEPGILLSTDDVHSDAITDILVIPNDGNLVTCSLDSRINYINVRNGQIMRTYTGHKRGVHSLCYSHQFNLLVSAGHEYNPLAWVINVPNSKPFVLRDGTKPHTSSLVGVVLVPSTAQCISVDLTGMVKIWDIRTLQCVQTILCEPHATREELRALHWKDFIYHSANKQIITSAKRKAYILEYNVQGRSIDPSSAMDFPISSAVHSPALGSFLACAKKDVRVWDDSTGSVLLSYEELVKDDIRCILLEPDGKWMYIGGFDGTVSCFNTNTGMMISEVSLMSGCEVTGLHVVQNYILAITVEGEVSMLQHRGGKLKVYPLLLPGGRPARIDAKTACVDPTYGYFLIGEGRNVVSVWLLEPVAPGQWKRVEECFNSPLNSEVTCVVSVGCCPCFVAADSSGGLHLWALQGPGVATPFQCIARWVTPQSRWTRYTPTVTCMMFYRHHKLLYTADDSGHINVYPLSASLKAACPDLEVEKPQDEESKAGRRYTTFLQKTTKRYALAPPKVHTWRAHADGISSMQLLDSQHCIMSAGSDCRLVLWSMWGNRITTLCRAKLEGFVYNLDMDAMYDDVPWPYNPNAKCPTFPQGKMPRKARLRNAVAAATLSPHSRTLPVEKVPLSATSPVLSQPLQSDPPAGATLSDFLHTSPFARISAAKMVAEAITGSPALSPEKAPSVVSSPRQRPEKPDPACSEYDYRRLLEQFNVYNRSSKQVAKMLFARAHQESDGAVGVEVSSEGRGSPPPEKALCERPTSKQRAASPPSLYPTPLRAKAPPVLTVEAENAYRGIIAPIEVSPPRSPIPFPSPVVAGVILEPLSIPRQLPQRTLSQCLPVEPDITELPWGPRELPSTVRYGAPEETSHDVVCGSTERWQTFLNRTNRRAVSIQRARYVVPNLKPNPTLPLSGEPVSRGVCPDIRTRTQCTNQSDGKRRKPLRLPVLHSKGEVLAGKHAGKLRTGPTLIQPRGGLKQEGDYTLRPKWDAWNSAGEGIALRRLFGHAHPKSWLVT